MNALQKLRERLGQINEEIRGINATAELEERAVLTEAEETRYSELRAERDQVEARIGQLEDEERRREADAAARRETGNQPAAVVTSEPTVYGRGSGNSYFLDVARAQVRGDAGAFDRLNRHAAELDVELPKREAVRARRASEQLDGLTRGDKREGYFEKRVNPNRTDGQGGYFVPPLWLVDEYIPFLRAGRAAADLCHNMDLPGGTDSINLPKVATGTATGVQNDNGSVTSQDLTDNFVSAPVRTIAGQQDIAMQLLDQSPVAFDEVVFKDLISSYNQQVDSQVLTGSGSAGQLKGISQVVTGANAITFTNASPTAALAYLPMAQALSVIARQRFLPATAFLGAPQRWYWFLSSLDSQNRPLVVPQGSAYNPIGTGGPGAEGADGNILGLPFYVDGNVPTNLGASTNQDELFAGRWDDAYLWEGAPRTRALTEVLSGTLQVRLQLWNYVAFMPDRYPQSFATINGTGLVTPTGF